MGQIATSITLLIMGAIALALTSCSSTTSSTGGYSYMYTPPDYGSRLASNIETSEKVVVINPREHAWGAYDSNGNLVKAGLATAGSDWCPDIGRPCRTTTGHFRVNSLGSETCKSKIFPVPKGGAPMPYCMFFNGGEAIHGVHEGEVVEGNISHGCVRLHVADAEWLRNNFVKVGTKVVVESY